MHQIQQDLENPDFYYLGPFQELSDASQPSLLLIVRQALGSVASQTVTHGMDTVLGLADWYLIAQEWLE